MGHAVDALATLAARTRWEDLPEAVRTHAKLAFLDTVGVILAGSVQPEVLRLREALLIAGGQGATVLAPRAPAADPRTAALLNGIAGRSIELCEGHRYVACQAAVQVLPAVLSAAELAGRGGAEVLAALVVGYDVAVRLGAGMTARPLAHQNGQTAMLGAVAAAARLRGLDAEGIRRALCAGAPLVLVPAYTNTVAGATALNVAGGMSGYQGALVADLVLAGFDARDGAVEEALGQLVGDGFAPAPVLDALGERWEITRNHFRLRACCNPIYAALDALEEALAALHPDPAEIERVDIATYHFASLMRERSPVNAFAARYSLPHAAAAIAVRGTAGYAAFTEEALHDPAVAALRARVTVTEDPAYTARVPDLKPARVTLTLKDGRSVSRVVESARGDHHRPHPESAIRAKFRELASVVVSATGVARIEGFVDRLDTARSIDELTTIVREESGRP